MFGLLLETLMADTTTTPTTGDTDMSQDCHQQKP